MSEAEQTKLNTMQLPSTTRRRGGNYSGQYGCTFTGQGQKLGEDRTIHAGMVPGFMFNDKGSG
jgi:hypothetical protein